MGWVFPAAVASPSMEKNDEDTAVEDLDTVDEVFICRGTSMDVPAAVSAQAIRKNAMFDVSLTC